MTAALHFIAATMWLSALIFAVALGLCLAEEKFRGAILCFSFTAFLAAAAFSLQVAA